jgi:hypothetical protein
MIEQKEKPSHFKEVCKVAETTMLCWRLTTAVLINGCALGRGRTCDPQINSLML